MKYTQSIYLQFALAAIAYKRLLVECGGSTQTTNYYSRGVEKMTCRRHESVPGLPGKTNDVIVCGDVQTAKTHIIFFGGDVQDYPEKMLNHRDNGRYMQWNLENTAVVLSKRCQGSAVFVVKPCRMHLNTFSVFSNFVESCNDFGSPTHLENSHSWKQLEALYRNTLTKELPPPLESCQKDTSCEVPLKLIGFSKGCVVLNQLLYDLQIALEDSSTKSFINCIHDYYWLDGGHSGGQNTWICDSEVLQTFSDLGKRIHVHVTPYQVKDPMRAWVGKEEKKFVSKLKKFGANITETMHFDDMPASIENHFGILELFPI